MANFFTLVSYHVENERELFYVNTQLQDLKISIGWGRVNPINKSHEEIKFLIETLYPEYLGTVNPHNGCLSLHMFAYLKPADIIFVRGDARILDIIIVTGNPFFDNVGHADGDYFLKVPFIPLFENEQTTVDTNEIPENIYNEVIFGGGRALLMRQISEENARVLLRSLIIE
jgi:hypothetical protein